jgi:hypothetical protein
MRYEHLAKILYPNPELGIRKVLVRYAGIDIRKMLPQSFLISRLIAFDKEDVARWLLLNCQQIQALKISEQGIREGESQYLCMSSTC